MKREDYTTAVGYKPKSKRMRRVGMLLCAALFTLHASLFTSCSESEDETTDEYANWQPRNDSFIASVAGKYQRLKAYTKDQAAEGALTDYIYYEVLETGEGTDSPLFTDSVRVSYRGRLIPSASYPEGYVFDECYTGDFSWKTTAVRDGVVSGYVTGFTTALQHMHRGDRWRIYVPYQLGYNKTEKTGIPIYSTLIFDLALVDFSRPGQRMSVWSARKIEN